MEHLPIHLPYGALVGGPVQYRWMYPFERFLHDLKSMIKNRSRVEGSICESYLSQESSYFSSYYFETHIESRSIRSKRNEDEGSTDQIPQTLSVFNLPGRPVGKCITRSLNQRNDWQKASLEVLINCDEVLPILEVLRSSVRYYYWNYLSDQQVEESVESNFVEWFQKYVHDPSNNVQNPHLQDLG